MGNCGSKKSVSKKPTKKVGGLVGRALGEK